KFKDFIEEHLKRSGSFSLENPVYPDSEKSSVTLTGIRKIESLGSKPLSEIDSVKATQQRQENKEVEMSH
ncbi:hypothetical protein HET73_01365, partial [Wolbachia endosymbiont of Atemnus politus]|uniref:hypothetical protein n=1 Tax=Wolbachia endosymbiont of Atemnus politus TaxID=2682840 RepID=UPI00157281E4